MFIKTFEQLKKTDVDIAGGKGASLGEMTSAGFPIPSGFVVLTVAFEEFLKNSDLERSLRSILKKVDYKNIHAIEKISENIQGLILNAVIPRNIQNKIKKEFAKLDTRFVAVRSSATVEDGLDHAWAGQLDSFLNITEDNLIKSVQKCWASLFTSRAIFYRFEKELQNTDVSVAVVVQKMVNSEKSGIAFSVHPVTEDHNQIIVEAGFGLGETIVSGSITPDAYVIEKEDSKIIDISINKQKKALCCKQNGGNEWKDLGERGEKQVLNKKEILELAGLIKKIEDHYGIPQDIEWAQEGGKFFITQSRPITTLGNKNKIERQEYRKIMTRPLSLIDCTCWDIGERIKLPEQFKNLLFFDPLFIYTPKKAVTIYYNFTDPKQNLQPLISYLERNILWFKKKKSIFDRNCGKIRKLIRNNSDDFEKIINLNHKIWPMVAVSNILGSTKFYKISKGLKKICIQIRKESDDVLHPSLSYINKIISNKLNTNTQNYLLSEVLNKAFPVKSELKKRKKGWVYHKGNIIFDIKKYCQENNIKMIKYSKRHKKYINGKIASSGIVKGKAKIIFELSDLDKIQENDILVAPMTVPEMIPIIKDCSAIITDEGGATCHAAIVSRELKIPCIIGTENATQILKDGDLVEVDANKGAVNILKKVDVLPLDYDDYQHFTQTKGQVSFGRSFGFLWHIRDMEGLVIYDGDKRRTFISKRKMQESLNNGNLLYSQKEFLLKLKKEIRDNYLKLKKTIEQIEEAGLNKKNLRNFIQYIDELSHCYRYTDFFFTDKYFKLKKITKREMKKFEQIKLDGRKYINNAVYVKNCFTSRLSIQASKKFNVAPKDIVEYSLGEILNLFENRKIDTNTINERKIGYIIYADKDKNINTIIGKKALRLINKFVPTINTSVLKGQVVSAGITRGRARVIHVSTDDFDSIVKVRKETKQGEILVTDSTIPEIIEACNKVSAIITNQGGDDVTRRYCFQGIVHSLYRWR